MSDTMQERIEFLTQLHTAWDGTEQRAALRGRPRRFISYHYSGMNSTQSQYLRALLYSTQTQILQFPLWHAARTLDKDLYRMQSIVPLKKEDMWNYRGAAGMMFWTKDEEGGAYYTMQSVTADGILHLSRQLPINYKARTVSVIPVFWGILQREDRYSNVTSEVTELMLNVEFVNRGLSVELPAAIDEWNYPRLKNWYGKDAPDEYMGRELFLMEPTWHRDMPVNYNRNASRLDNETGVIRYDLKSSDTTEGRTLGYNAMNLEEVQFLQRFFYRCKGRLKSFYAPTWLSDVELAKDATTGNTLIAKFNLYWKYYAANKRRKNLIVFFKDGTIEILKIAGFGLDETKVFGKVFLDTPISRALCRKDIRMISFLCLYRLNSDALTTDYDAVNKGSINFEFLEVTE